MANKNIIGGARPGSGRKKGVPNKITLAARKRAAAKGESSLEVMAELMHWARKQWLAEARKKTPNEDVVMVKFKATLDAAKELAPYMHAKHAAIQHTGKGGGPIQHATVDLSKLSDEQLAALEPVAAALAAAGDLAGADPGGEGEAQA